jgi:hypothetical protein
VPASEPLVLPLPWPLADPAPVLPAPVEEPVLPVEPAPVPVVAPVPLPVPVVDPLPVEPAPVLEPDPLMPAPLPLANVPVTSTRLLT